MQIKNRPHDRRQFIRLMTTLSTGALLAGCGSGGSGGSGGGAIGSVVSVTAPTAATPLPTTPGTSDDPLNLALNLTYLGAQFYGFAANGTGLPTQLTGGVGQTGLASGARRATFDDATIAGYAAELAADKQAHVVALRKQIGPLAAAKPTLDLSATASGAFSRAAQGAGIVAAGVAFDPYASATNFLLGAFLIENIVAAAYRTLLAETADTASAAVVAANLADAIYHGGLIRTLLDDRAATNGAIDTALGKASALLATFDGSDVGDQTLAGASGISMNLLDADGRPIPFTRASDQVLKALYLSSTGIGGFLPAGANGLSA